jgi:hypothetical protein
MTRLVALVLGVVVLAGCGSVLLHESHWTGGDNFARDRYACLQDADRGSILDAVYRRKLFQSCMAARDWKEVGNQGW